MSVVPGETVIRIGACGGRDGPVQRDSWGLLIRSGDGDLFGQTAARAPTRTCWWGSCRRATPTWPARRLIIAVASRRQHHDFTKRGR